MTTSNSPATQLHALSRDTTTLARRFLLVALLLGFLVSLGSTDARAQCTAVPGVNVINWTDPLSDAWSVASDWNLDCVPNNGTPPGAAYDVRIINGGGVELDINATVDTVTIGNTSGLIAAGGNLNVNLGFDNVGSLLFSSFSFSSSVNIAGAFTNESGGMLTMNGTNDTLTAGSVSNNGTITLAGPGQPGFPAETLTSKGDFDNNSSGIVAVTGFGNTLNVDGSLNNAGTLTMGGTGDILTAGSVTNNGTITLTVTATETLTSKGDFDNNSTGSVTLSGTSNTLNIGGNLNNAGSLTLQSSFGGSGSVVNVTGALNNTGTLIFDLNQDTLTAGSVTNNGTITLEGTPGTLTSKGNFDNNSGGSVTLFSTGSTLNVGANLNNAGSLTLSTAGILTGVSIVNVTGALNNESGAALTMASMNDTLTAGSVSNNGTITLDGTSETLSSKGDFGNNAGGSVTLSGIAGGNTNTLNVGANLKNAGSLTLSGSLSTVSVSGALNNTGTLTFGSGSSQGTVTVAGTFSNGAGAALTMSGGFGSLTPNDTLTVGSVSNDGTITLNGNSEVLTSTGDFDNNSGGSVTVMDTNTLSAGANLNNAGFLTATGGTAAVNVSGALNNTGTLTVASATVNVTGALNNTGTLTFALTMSGGFGTLTVGSVSNFGRITLNNGGTASFPEPLTSKGDFNNNLGGSVAVTGLMSGLNADANFNNSGALMFDPTSNSGRVTVAGAFNNGSGGALTMNGAGDTLTAGSVSNNGGISVGAGETLNSTGAYTQTGGSTDVAGSLKAGSYSQSGGSTTIELGGTILTSTFTVSGGSAQVAGTIVGAVSVGGGSIQPGTPGTPGTLNIIGSYTQGALGTLIIDLGGTGTGQFGVLSITAFAFTDAASLDGTVDFTAVNGFIPAIGDDLTFLLASDFFAASPVSGTFANLVLTNWNCPANATCTLDYAPNSVTLDIDAASTTPTPEPATLLLLGTAMLGIGAHFRRRKSRPSDALSN